MKKNSTKKLIDVINDDDATNTESSDMVSVSNYNTMDEMIGRINELYRKSQAEGLTSLELKEQKELRSRYITNIRGNLRGQLNNISIENPDGTIVNLGEKYGNKTEH